MQFPLLPIGQWAALLCAPVALLALAAAIAPRWRAGITMLVVAASGLATAFLAVGITVSFTQGAPVAIWPGAGLSLAWLGVVGAALVTLDTAITLPRLRVAATTASALALVICAVPALTAFHTDRSALTNGPQSTLPAYVAAQAASEGPVGTLVLTAQNDGGLAVDVVWGESETLGAQSTMMSTATEPQGADISVLSVDLLSARDFDAPGELAAQGISYVLLAQRDGGEGDKARALRTSAISSIDQRAGFVHAGTTERGVLWRVEADVSERTALSSAQQGTARLVITVQLMAILAALLLSVPTRASRRAARAQSRIVGRAPEEPLVLPRHAEDLHVDEDTTIAPPETIAPPADLGHPDETAAPESTAPEETVPPDETLPDETSAEADGLHQERDAEEER